MIKSDLQLHKDIAEELAFDPRVDDSNLGIAVDDGVVTLSGTIPTFAQKYAAESAARRVLGVRGSVSEIVVELHGTHRRTDTDIARAAVDALTWNVLIPDTVKVTVNDGTLVLSGSATWQYEREEAAAAVRSIMGVRDVVNTIAVTPRVVAADVQHQIENEFLRTASADARHVRIETDAGCVILRGTVHSVGEREAAVRAAWHAPGVIKVDDDLKVAP